MDFAVILHDTGKTALESVGFGNVIRETHGFHLAGERAVFSPAHQSTDSLRPCHVYRIGQHKVLGVHVAVFQMPYHAAPVATVGGHVYRDMVQPTGLEVALKIAY